MDKEKKSNRNIKQKLFFLLSNNWPYLLGLFIVFFFFAFNVTGLDLAYFPGDLGDGRFNTYILEHAHKFLTLQESSLWEAPFMYPEPHVITYSDNLVGSAPFYSVWRMFTDRETSFQLWFITMYFLNFTFSYLFLNSTFKNKYAAVLGAMIFTISIALQSQMTHAQTFPRFPIPIAFWMAMLFMKDLKPHYFFLTLLAVVYQFYCGIYLGFFLIAPISILLLAILVVKRKELINKVKTLKWNLLILTSLIINTVVLLLLMLPYMERSKTAKVNYYWDVIDSVPTIRSYFSSQQGSLFWDFLSNTSKDYPAFWDHQIFTGIIAMTAMLVFILLGVKSLFIKNIFNKLNLSKEQGILLISCVGTFVFYTRFQGYSMYKILYDLPGFNSMRSLTRIINIELLFYGIALTLITVILFKYIKKKQWIVFMTLLSLVTLDNYFKPMSSYKMDKKVSQARVSKLTQQMKHIPEGSLVSYEFKGVIDSEAYHQIDGMLAAQSYNLKCINAYSADIPEGFYHYFVSPSAESRQIWFDKKQLQADTVYVVTN